MFTTKQGIPITIDLVTMASSTGWVVNSSQATHEHCNAGTMYLKNHALVVGAQYIIDYKIVSISGGLFRVLAGATAGPNDTTPGTKQITITAAGTNPVISFYSDADCVVSLLDYQRQNPSTDNKSQNTLVYSEKLNRWLDYRPLNPDWGFSLFTVLYTLKNGDTYYHDRANPLRNNFYGVQYDTIIKFVDNSNPAQAQLYVSMNYNANTLMITSPDGIVTSEGQISDLVEQDFLYSILSDTHNSLNIYNVDGFYKGFFLRDKNSSDIINGDFLKGTYILIELKTINFNQPLKLVTVGVESTKSNNAIR